MPNGPIILLLCNAGILQHRLSFRPACELIQGIYRGWRAALEPWRAVRVAQGAQIEQHRHASPGLARMDKSATHKGISQPMCPVGWVRDDILGQGRVRF